MKTQTNPLSLYEAKQVNGGFLTAGSAPTRSNLADFVRLRNTESFITQALRETGGQFSFIN